METQSWPAWKALASAKIWHRGAARGSRCRARRCRRSRRTRSTSPTLGTVAGLIDTGAHPVLRVSDGAAESAERLIPLVPAYVDAIDLAAGRVVVDWPVDY
jgi:hypothetical protein